MKPTNLSRPRFIEAILSVATILILVITGPNCFSQGTLNIPKNTVYQLDKDTLIINELVLNDSAKIVLTHAKHFVKVKRLVVGQGNAIIGNGTVGANGVSGKTFPTPSGICKAGINGEIGKQGFSGEPGKDLIIEVTQIEGTAVLTIELNGGSGGDGGNGGKGGHGSNTVVHCTANGGNGGNGGSGGNGGNGGTLTLKTESNLPAIDLAKKLSLNNRGGYRGLGGEAGQGGLRGHGASESISKMGQKGKAGVNGQYGKDGRPLFFSIFKAGDGRTGQTSTPVSDQ